MSDNTTKTATTGDQQRSAEREKQSGSSADLVVFTPSKIGPYTLLENIGQGAYAVVKHAINIETNQHFACKIIPKKRLSSEKNNRFFEQEIRILRQMHHKNVVQLYDLLKDTVNYYILIEYCPQGELFSKIFQEKRFSEHRAKFFFFQILSALKYVHAQNVAHRDLKPENILIDNYGNIKISDFGLSKYLGNCNVTSTSCGSPCYMAPEVFGGDLYDPMKADLWSLGVILFTMVTGGLPWTKRNRMQLFNEIKTGEYILPSYLSDECKELITSLINLNPDDRITIDNALEHPFMKDAKTFPTKDGELPVVSLRKVDVFFEREKSDPLTIADQELTSSTGKLNYSFEKVQLAIQPKKELFKIRPSPHSCASITKCESSLDRMSSNPSLIEEAFSNQWKDISKIVANAKLKKRRIIVRPRIPTGISKMMPTFC